MWVKFYVVNYVTKEINDIPKDLNLWGFDEWQQLYQKDPALYEQYRQQLLLQVIADAPEHQQDRLKGLLFTLDGEKRRSKSVEAEQVRYYGLMMDSLAKLNEQILSLFDHQKEENQRNKETAQILDFKNKNK